MNIKQLNKEIFLDFKIPNRRGDISKVKLKNKYIFLVDESYNSNPLSLKTAIENFDKIESKNSKKYLILGDMLELGKHSEKLDIIGLKVEAQEKKEEHTISSINDIKSAIQVLQMDVSYIKEDVHDIKSTIHQ